MKIMNSMKIMKIDYVNKSELFFQLKANKIKVPESSNIKQIREKLLY